jgi:hypothetical protein
MVTVKTSTVVAAYLIATAFVVGAMSNENRWRCPSETNAQQIGFSVFAGIVWPIAIPPLLLGWKHKGPPIQCFDGSIAQKEPD